MNMTHEVFNQPTPLTNYKLFETNAPLRAALKFNAATLSTQDLSQLGATLTGAAAYLVGLPAAFILFGLIRQFVIKQDWVFTWMVSVPGVASQIMISPERLPVSSDAYMPSWWVGALVLTGYGVVAGVVGTLITRKRDIS